MNADARSSPPSPVPDPDQARCDGSMTTAADCPCSARPPDEVQRAGPSSPPPPLPPPPSPPVPPPSFSLDPAAAPRLWEQLQGLLPGPSARPGPSSPVQAAHLLPHLATAGTSSAVSPSAASANTHADRSSAEGGMGPVGLPSLLTQGPRQPGPSKPAPSATESAAALTPLDQMHMLWAAVLAPTNAGSANVCPSLHAPTSNEEHAAQLHALLSLSTPASVPPSVAPTLPPPSLTAIPPHSLLPSPPPLGPSPTGSPVPNTEAGAGASGSTFPSTHVVGDNGPACPPSDIQTMIEDSWHKALVSVHNLVCVCLRSDARSVDVGAGFAPSTEPSEEEWSFVLKAFQQDAWKDLFPPPHKDVAQREEGTRQGIVNVRPYDQLKQMVRKLRPDQILVRTPVPILVHSARGSKWMRSRMTYCTDAARS